MATTAGVPTFPPDVFGIFCGQIDQAAVQRIFQNLTIATNPSTNIKHVHLLFQSSGGFIGDGVCLYNFFRAFPVELTLYNTGSIMSIATIAYLGAKNRKTSANAMFGIHRSVMSPQAAFAGSLQAYAQALTLEDQRTEAILREHLRLPEGKWTSLQNNADLTFLADEAVAIGLATEIGDFSPPPGSQIFNV